MSLAEIVQVTISASTSQPSRQGFGVPLLLGYHTRFAEVVRTYTSLAGMVSDGFTVNDPMYKMASAALSQNPRPPKIKIGRLAAAVPHTTEIQPTVTGSDITMTVRDAAGAITLIDVAYDTSLSVTATALAAAINAISGVGAAAAGAVVTVDADTNGPVVYFESVTGGASVRDVTADGAYDTRLGEIMDVDSDFYAVAIDVNSPANIADVSAWVLANRRLAFFAPQYTTPADYDTAADALALADNDRAISLVKSGQGRGEYAEVAWMGRCLPFDPGSITWALKSLAGVTPDPWTATQQGVIEAQGSNHYTRVAGINITREGKAHGGEFIDVMRGLDWLVARIQERIFGLLANARKIPFTDSGAQMVIAELKGQLLDAARQGIIDEDSIVVTVPLVADVPLADRAARILSGVEFSARLQGAIHKVLIIGNVSV